MVIASEYTRNYFTILKYLEYYTLHAITTVSYVPCSKASSKANKQIATKEGIFDFDVPVLLRQGLPITRLRTRPPHESPHIFRNTL